MINDKADNFQYINQKSSRRISRINPPEMAKGNVGTCDRRKEEAERGRNDEIRCHMHDRDHRDSIEPPFTIHEL